MDNLTKILIMAVIILVGVVGVFAGYYINQPSNTPNNSSTVYVNQSSTQTQGSWHELTSYSGVNSETDTFQIKGSEVKIVMSAKPTVNYDTNELSVDLLKSTGATTTQAITTGTVDWTATENPVTKTKTLQASSGSGTYQINVAASNLANWTVTVYDYY